MSTGGPCLRKTHTREVVVTTGPGIYVFHSIPAVRIKIQVSGTHFLHHSISQSQLPFVMASYKVNREAGRKSQMVTARHLHLMTCHDPLNNSNWKCWNFHC